MKFSFATDHHTNAWKETENNAVQLLLNWVYRDKLIEAFTNQNVD